MKLEFKTKLSYGIGGVADNAMYTLVGTFLMFFLTTVAEIRPAAAGTIVAIGSVWEAFCGPICGYASDNIRTRFGKRKPFLLAAAFPVAIVTSLLFSTIHAGYGIRIFYYGAMTILFWQSFSLFFVPYMAWGSELTEDYHQRTVLRSYAYVFNQVGMALGMVLPSILVDWLMNSGYSISLSWTAVGFVAGIISCAALLICAMTIKKTDVPNFKKDPHREKILTPSKIGAMFKEYFQILHLKPIQYIIGASLLYLIANTIFSSDRVYYFTYNLHLSAGQISLVMMLITVLGIALTPLVATVCGKTDKKLVFLWGIGFTGIALMIWRFLGWESFAAACVLCCIYSLGNTCYWQLMPSMIYDVCEAEELASGEKHSGAVISLQALSESLSTAIGVQILGIILERAEFAEDVVTQGETALAWVSNCYSFIPGLCMVLVAIVVHRYPINKNTFPRIMAAVEKRRNGEKVDMTQFEDIYGKRRIDNLTK